MREEKRNTDNPADGYRTEYIGVRVSPKLKGNIRRSVPKCGMPVSGYIPARASGYKLETRLTESPESVMGTLAVCRGNLTKYTSALRSMNPGKRRQMFESYPFMPGWSKELDRLAEQFTDILDKIRLFNIVPAGQGTVKTRRMNQDSKDEIRLPRNKRH